MLLQMFNGLTLIIVGIAVPLSMQVWMPPAPLGVQKPKK